MNGEEKIHYFEYVIYKLLEWQSEDNASSSNDFSTLKLMKLLFFVSAAEPNESKSFLIDNVFDNFIAMPYGHVESDVYDILREKGGLLNHYQINNRCTEVVDPIVNTSGLNQLIVNEINTAISYLKTINYGLIKMSQFDLVNLSHAWYSWQHFYAIAFSQGKKSYSIPKDFIKFEDKIYSLTPF